MHPSNKEFCFVGNMNITLVLNLGFVGLFNLFLLWPGFLLLHYAGLEPFELPSKLVCMYIIINGLIGTVLSEFLWLWYVQDIVKSLGYCNSITGVNLE